ncbi:MAG: YceI family protein [Marinoscillum sp.]
MSRGLISLLLSLLLMSCSENKSLAHQQIDLSPVPNHFIVESDTVLIDLTASILHWKGTKMSGAGKHEGEIMLQDGYLLQSKNELVGGAFEIDMNSITVNDIPIHEPVPRKRLTNHLKSDDFFDVETYPTATFQILDLATLAYDSLEVNGLLTMKDITIPITFSAIRVRNTFTAHVMIDRFQWNIAYEGNWLDRTFVDPEFELRIKLIAE